MFATIIYETGILPDLELSFVDSPFSAASWTNVSGSAARRCLGPAGWKDVACRLPVCLPACSVSVQRLSGLDWPLHFLGRARNGSIGDGSWVVESCSMLADPGSNPGLVIVLVWEKLLTRTCLWDFRCVWDIFDQSLSRFDGSDWR